MTLLRNSMTARPSRLTSNAVLFTLATLPFASLAGAATPEKIRPVPEKIIVVPDRPDYRPDHRPDYRPVDIEVWTDRGENGSYCIGEPISIYFRTNADAWVAILDTDTRGETNRLFPNRWDREHFAEAGRVYRLPIDGYRFQVEGPPGRETLHAIAALDRHDLRRAAEQFLDPYRPVSHDDWRDRSPRRVAEKIVVVPDPVDVAFDSTSHVVRGGAYCGLRPRPHHRLRW